MRWHCTRPYREVADLTIPIASEHFSTKPRPTLAGAFLLLRTCKSPLGSLLLNIPCSAAYASGSDQSDYPGRPCAKNMGVHSRSTMQDRYYPFNGSVPAVTIRK